MKKKKIRFNHFAIEMFILPNNGKTCTIRCGREEIIVDGSTLGMCCSGSSGKPFALVLRKGWTAAIVAHECWHLFFGILSYMACDDSCPVTYGELGGEIYAYRFSNLVDMVMRELKGL